MGSMMESSEGWTREDELDLGPENQTENLPAQPDQDALDHPTPSAEAPDAELDTLDDDALDQASEKTAEPAAHSRGPRKTQYGELTAASGSVDETASTPDDTPSLHVSHSPWTA